MTIFQRPEGFPEPERVGPGTKLEYIDPEDVENEDYGEVLAVEGGIAEVAWHKSGRREEMEIGELTDFVVKDWDREHWSLEECAQRHGGR